MMTVKRTNCEDFSIQFSISKRQFSGLIDKLTKNTTELLNCYLVSTIIYSLFTIAVQGHRGYPEIPLTPWEAQDWADTCKVTRA